MEGIRTAARAGAGADAGRLQTTSSNNSEQPAASVSASASSYKSPKRHAGEISERPVAVKPETKSSSGDFTEKSRFVADWMKPGNECSMCGDVGFVQDLLLCKRCGYRLQHTYCSKLYPDLDMETWACEWCLYEEEKNGAAKTKVGKRKSGSLTESRNKAFEFLLQIAQASPSSSSSSRDTKREREGDKRQRENGDTGRPNATASRKEKENGFKCGNVVLKVGNVEQKQVARSSSSSLKEENAVKLRHLSENWNCKEENGMESVGHVPKKQRCNHPTEKNKTLDKWSNLAKSKLHCNTSKAIGRRYKLLADVLC